mgnify:CR=1 FL=1
MVLGDESKIDGAGDGAGMVRPFHMFHTAIPAFPHIYNLFFGS